ncbi:MAG: hypothetical protein ACXVZQ_11300 [Terriglobales bacterium]
MRKTAFLVVAVILIISAAAMAANQFGISDKREVTFYDPVMIGQTLVPAGNYTVVHQMQGNDHLMVFTKVGNKSVAATVKCSLTPLKAAASRTEVEYKTSANNTRVLSRIVFKGDRAEHIF